MIGHLLLAFAIAGAALVTWMLWDLAGDEPFDWDDGAPRKAKVRRFAIGVGIAVVFLVLVVGLLCDSADLLTEA